MSFPEINDLARHIARSDPEDAGEQATIRDTLAELRSRVQGEKAHDVRLRLDSALLLTEYLRQVDGVGGDEILRIISRLVASLDPYFSPSVTLRRPREGETGMEDRGESAGAASVPEDEHALLSNMLLGEILVQFGTINSAQVCEALELQDRKRIPFGEALIELGAATRGDVRAAVGYQEGLRTGKGLDDDPPAAALPALRPVRSDLRLVSDMLLGDLLVRMGKVTQEQLERGLRDQRATGTRIGEALVQLGFATWKDIQEALQIQTERRVSVL